MASRDPLYSYKETRLNFEPSSTALIVDIKLPEGSSGGRSRRRLNGTGDAAAEDERAFRAKHCATSSGVYHRKHNATLKNFLWRVLEDDTVLSIHNIDVCKVKKAPDANLILNLRFPQPLRPTCIALADPQDHDALNVFVFDQSNQLYSISLRPDSFRRRSITESGLAEACRIISPSAFSFKTPHRLVAVSDDLLVVTTHDGGMVRLDRNKGHDALNHPWKEFIYSSKGWTQGIRSLLTGSHTVKYRGVSMDLSSAASVATTDIGVTDASFLFTVCLDHRLRVWNLRNGHVLDARDLLDAERNPQEVGKWTIDPSQTNLIKIVDHADGRRLCVTYSPIGAGEFKFWKVESTDKDHVHVSDFFPGLQLEPPPPLGSDVWVVADFIVTQVPPRGTQLWVLWKNNMTYRVQHVSFEPENVEEAWQSGWTSVYADNSIPTAQTSGPCDATDATEKWLQLILYPGRFTQATLGTALSIYEQGLGAPRDSSSRASKGLAESICSALASTSSLDRSSSGGMDYEQFRNSSDIHWRRFYRLLVELDKQRGEALALVHDPESEMTWVVCADGLSAIRDCNQLEQICNSPTAPHGDLSDVSSLLSTGLNFVDVFSDNMTQVCNSVLRLELFEESSKTDEDRIQYFSDKAGFWRQLSDEDCAQVTDALGQNFNLVTPELYDKTFDLMNAPEESRRETPYQLTDFGRKLAVKAVQEIAELQWSVCFSQLILVVHMEFEFDRPEDALHHRVPIGPVYRDLVASLRRLELIRWLAKTQLSVPLSKVDRDRSSSISEDSLVAPKRTVEDFQIVTAFEAIVGHLLGVADMESIPAGITDLATNVCAENSDIELLPQALQCFLLVQNRPDLAVELGSFCEQDPFSTYTQGRVQLALKDLGTAAAYFKKAAYGLSIPLKHPGRYSSGLLDDTEWSLFYAGMPQYYAHIVALFEKAKAHSYVVEFARLALQFVNKQTKDAIAVRTEIQSRLFNAAVSIAQFDLAHATLVSMSDRALQHSCLRTLLQKMCDNLHNAELVELPFPNLENAVDDILAQKCHTTLDVVTGVPYHQILYAWRIKRNDYRGAAAILLDRIQKLRQMGEADQLISDDVLDTAVTRQYLMLINVLSCVETKQAWINTEEPLTTATTTTAPAVSMTESQTTVNASASFLGTPTRRKVVTLADIRREYQDELDRIAAIQNNQFGFAEGDEMDVL